MPSHQPLRVVVCGAGAFGRNHIRVYRELQQSGFPLRLAAIVEPHSDRAHSIAAETSLPVFPSLDLCLAHTSLHAASVCVPTSAHFDVAAQLLHAGLHLLIEKPIASTLHQADELIRLAALHQRILQVGHLERFNPAVAALAALTHQPMFFEAHRLSIFSPRALDVDVVLDLMIHDLDIVLHLANSPVRHVHAVGLPILSSQVDIANARIEFDSGCVANFTASRVSTERVRKLRFFQPHQYLSVDYARQDLLIISVDPTATTTPTAPPASNPTPAVLTRATTDPTIPAAPFPPTSAHPSPSLSFHKPPITPAEPLRLEIESFLNCIQTQSLPIVSAHQARRALALALEVQSAIHAHSQRANLHRLS